MYTCTIELCDDLGHLSEVDLSDLDPEMPVYFYEDYDDIDDDDVTQYFTLYFKSGYEENFKVDKQTPDNIAILHYIDETW